MLSSTPLTGIYCVLRISWTTTAQRFGGEKTHVFWQRFHLKKFTDTEMSVTKSRMSNYIFLSVLCLLLHRVNCGDDDYDPCKAGINNLYSWTWLIQINRKFWSRPCLSGSITNQLFQYGVIKQCIFQRPRNCETLRGRTIWSSKQLNYETSYIGTINVINELITLVETIKDIAI